MKALHEKNLVVPVSGDFGGPKAIRAIGAYLQKQGAVVSAFYVQRRAVSLSGRQAARLL